jgi:predicted transcriptional regulator
MNSKDQDIVLLASTGCSQEEIAATMGVSQSTVSRRLQSEELKALIEKVQFELMEETATVAKDNLVHAIKSYKTSKEDPQLREHGFKATQRVLESMGILPTHTQSVFIQQIFNDNRTQIAPVIRQVLDAINTRDDDAGNMLEAEIVEGG